MYSECPVCVCDWRASFTICIENFMRICSCYILDGLISESFILQSGTFQGGELYVTITRL